MTTRVQFSGLDYSKEGTSSSLYMVDLTAANFDARGTALTAVQNAIKGVSLIDYDGKVYPAHQVARENTPPVSTNAQREAKWRLTLVDQVNNRISHPEIGGADTSLLVANTDLMDLAAGAGLTLKTDIEANCVSRDGNAVVLTEARYVGRAI